MTDIASQIAAVEFLLQNERRVAPSAKQRHREIEAALATLRAAPALVEMAKLFERSIVYEIKRSERDGDDEGARLKSFTLAEVRAAIAAAKGTP